VTGATQLTHAGNRIYFGLDGNSASEYSLDQLSGDGKVVLDNALVEFGLEPVPEPSTVALAALALLGFVFYRRR
jgi:hypothetical protein